MPDLSFTEEEVEILTDLVDTRITSISDNYKCSFAEYPKEIADRMLKLQLISTYLKAEWDLLVKLQIHGLKALEE